MSFSRAISALTVLLPLINAAAVPVYPLEEIHNDAIRYMKCAGLTTVKNTPEYQGDWEQGMIGYYADKSASGGPAERIIDM